MQPLEPEDPQHLGAYRLLGRLGAGGMGRVYLARSPGGRTVAVKVVRPELAEDAQFRARFRHEVEIARAVSGGYTAPVVDADTESRLPWLATAYVLGPPLDEVIEQHGPLPEASVRALGAGLAEALVVIHGAGLVHRDLKPSNVLLAADGPRVIDFGIARAVDGDRMTSTGVVVGSPGYIPPEQAVGGVAGPPGDVFSLGVVLAYAATGQQPFGLGTAASLLYQVVHGTPNLTEVPASLRPLVQACLQKDPAQRPTPQQISEALAPAGAASVLRDWLPGPVSSTIARHASRILDLDTPAHGTADGAAGVAAGGAVSHRTPTTLDGTVLEPAGAAGSAGAAGVSSAAGAFGASGASGSSGASVLRSRRGFLALGAGVAVAAAGGGAVWALGRKDDDKPKPPPAADGTKNPTTPSGAAQWPGGAARALWSHTGTPLQMGLPLVVDGSVVLPADPVVALLEQGGKQRWSGEKVIDRYARLAVSGGSVIGLDESSDMIAVDARSGQEAWRYKPAQYQGIETLLAADRTAVYYMGSKSDADSLHGPAMLVAVDTATRKERWREQRDAGTLSNSVEGTVGGRYLVYADGSSNVTVRDTRDGRQIWTKKLGDRSGTVRPVLSGDTLYLCGKELRAVDVATSKVKWSVSAGSDGYFGAPVVADGVVYVGDTITGIRALNAADGKRIWIREIYASTSVSSSPVLTERGVYVASQLGGVGVFALDRKAGSVTWNFHTTLTDDSLDWRLAAGKDVVVASNGGQVFGLPAI
ncbi:serine/threonine-protein kinase [Streptomyces sp. NPDC006733]|uniref:serine/threonine-protein kinase n=1 Tax=Streptomyces sp. NPDC006733 TaxID=3155460 RepID=UPI0033E04CCB